MACLVRRNRRAWQGRQSTQQARVRGNFSRQRPEPGSVHQQLVRHRLVE